MNQKQNRLKQLRAFVHASQTGSISKAAERLDLSQPSVSLQIKALEDELQTTLFERRGPRIKITPAGKILYDITLPLVEGMDRLADSFAAKLGDIDSGTLVIAAGESTILYILPKLVSKFNELYPNIRIRLRNVTGRDGMGLLRADEADFAVGSMIERVDDMEYYPIYNFNPVLITPQDHPLAKAYAYDSQVEDEPKKHVLTLEDISPHGLILPPRHLSTWRAVKTVFQQYNIPYKVTLEAGGWEVIKKYVEIGMGISIVTDICITGEEKLCVLPLKEYFPKRSYGVVMRQGKHISPQARRFLEIMHDGLIDQIDSKVKSKV